MPSMYVIGVDKGTPSGEFTTATIAQQTPAGVEIREIIPGKLTENDVNGIWRRVRKSTRLRGR